MTANSPDLPPLRVLLVDDETLARTRMQTLLGDCRTPRAVVQAQAADARQALQWLRAQSFDLVLLDIHMPGLDGLALAQTIRAQPHAPAVIFVTAYAEHALQAFELAAIDYLTKPVRLERLQLALQKAQRFVQAPVQPRDPSGNDDALIIQERARTERVPLDEVLYFKAELKYVTVRTARRSYLLDETLNELEARYPQRFLRIHRNALVARRALRVLQKHQDAQEGEGWAVRLEGVDEPLVVSRRQLAAVRELLSRA